MYGVWEMDKRILINVVSLLFAKVPMCRQLIVVVIVVIVLFTN